MTGRALDPVTFVRNAMRDLPTHPAEAKADDIQRVVAMADGVAAYLLDVEQAIAAVDLDQPDCRDDIRWNLARSARCRQALAALDRYLSAACRAMTPDSGVGDPDNRPDSSGKEQ